METIYLSPALGPYSPRAARHGFGHFHCSIAITLSLLSLASSLWAVDDGCKALTPELGTHVTEYLAQRIVSESGGTPSIVSSEQVPGTCYRKLVIHVSGTANPLTLYLSPDQRFLTSTLYDLAMDPSEEKARVAADVEKLLLRDDSPQLTGTHSRVVIVEFGDLQCPYCKLFADWYHSLPAELRDQTTLIFKHFPLARHPWAQYSACANQQSPAAFWELANYLLAHQDETTPANIKDKVAEALARAPNVDAQSLISCATSEVGAGLVARDIAVAKELAVSRTPTVYISGHQAPPLQSQQDFQRLLERKLGAPAVHVTAAGK